MTTAADASATTGTTGTTGTTSTTGATTEPVIHRGLAGVVADTTKVSNVMAETNSLTYRGYAVQDLTAHCSFEQVAYLLWHGELPTPEELVDFQAMQRPRRALSPGLMLALRLLPTSCHPMDTLRTAVSWIGTEDPDAGTYDEAANQRKSEMLLAQIATVVAIDHRRRLGQEPIPPDESLNYVDNFFHMCFGSVPSPQIARAFETSLILYMEHSFNASTFTARVVTSTMSDQYSAVTAAIGALKGPLHGGANEAVMHTMLEIGHPAKAADWMRAELAAHRKIMGFGHRVYKNEDSRVPTMKAALWDTAAVVGGGERWTEMYTAMEQTMLAERGIYPNLDFPTGPAYYLMGFNIEMFTPMFVMSRVVGWTAHIAEQRAHNALIRPLSSYDGVPQRAVPIELATR
ncbi:bifunctional 2-methylcitrate synthase/citrate synthase [Pengzhenrongella frigida]|uniref:Citrate synthase n=1 Tax=Pengzhenrongella frigida TaxID=1259133 RepID=A0A4Q5N3C5_9MICO|nr:bifunctional 2-methylcitrate synthase/citrate synthase [Cellulomonas sp. HLT2-17]RYV50511.1 bifunctional 2-methylcitrate synthase/citrate synthase [Cellulomonas sp. HLT2-17]